MKKIKIVRIITRLNIGGPATHVLLLSRFLPEERFETTLVTGSCDKYEGDMLYLVEQFGVKPVFVKEMLREINPWNDLRALFKIYKILKKEKPDIVHTHTAKAGALGRIASILAGRCVRIHTFHGHSLQGYFSKGKSRFFLSVERILAGFTDKVIAISEEQLDALSLKYGVAGRDKFSVINLGLDLEEFLKIKDAKVGRFRKQSNISENTTLIGMVGRLVNIKNPRMFLDAIKQVESTARSKDYKFVIVGDGDLKKGLIDYTKKIGVTDLVLFTGWYKDIWEVYEGLDIAVLTSLNEGTPVSLIQALASARPVISTDVGGVRSVVIDGKNGYLVRVNDVSSLSEKVLDLASDPEKKNVFGRFGREYVRDRFSEKRLVKDLETLYLDLVEKRKG